MAKVSVIVPIHNINKNIKKCLDSILNQTLEDIEIIIVNDNQSTNMLELLDYYEKSDSRIKVFNIDVEKGMGFLRNIGIAHASSKYVGFVDTEDYLDPEMYKRLHTGCLRINADIGTCQIETVKFGFKNKKEVEIKKDEETIRPQVTSYYLNDIEPTCVNKLYNHDYIDNFYFDEDIDYEDYCFTTKTLGNADKVYILKRGLYYHPEAKEIKQLSLSDLDIFKANDRIRKYYIDNGLIVIYQYALDSLFTINTMNNCSSILDIKMPNSDKQELITNYVRYIELEYGNLTKNNKYIEKKEKDKAFGKKMKALESNVLDNGYLSINDKDEIIDNIKKLILKNSGNK